MQIEEYFNFLAENDIRIRGTRIGIETVLDEYIHEGKTAEAIADRYHNDDTQNAIGVLGVGI